MCGHDVSLTFFSRPIGGGSGQSSLREAAAAQHLTGGYQMVPEDHLGAFRPWCWPVCLGTQLSRWVVLHNSQGCSACTEC
jgi:hypothetical protein